MRDKRYLLLVEKKIGTPTVNVHEINGNYMRDACDNAEWLIRRNYDTDNHRLKSAIVYEVDAVDSIDLDALYRQTAEERAIANASKEELAEREMLAKLRAKYPNA